MIIKKCQSKFNNKERSRILMKKTAYKVLKVLVKGSVYSSANSTSSLFCYEPKAPKLLRKFSKYNDK